MENKQMSDAVHESLTDIFTNYMNPKFDSLKKRMTELESLVEGKFEKAESAGSKTLKDLTSSLDKLDERVIDLHALMTQVLEWATDPNNLMNLIEASGKGNVIANQILNNQLTPANDLHYTQEELPIGEPWHSVDEQSIPLPHSESIEDFDSAYRKHGPDTLRFNNTLTHDECKKALDAYHAWVTRKLLPADPKDRGLKDLSNHIMKKIREHFKKRQSGMTLTELANEVKATQLSWKQSSQVQGWLKRSALGILSVSRDLEIVPVSSANGGRPTTFLYHKDDWASIVKTGNGKTKSSS
jgi:archaellum component FlaC